MEVVGPSHTCQLTDLPESRHGHAAVRLGDSVVVCGGLSGRHIHERSDKSHTDGQTDTYCKGITRGQTSQTSHTDRQTDRQILQRNCDMSDM